MTRILVEYTNAEKAGGGGGLGPVGGTSSSNTERLARAYPSSPMNEDLTDDEVRAIFARDALGGDNGGVISDGGHTFGEVSINYGDSPDISTVESGGPGQPGSPWTPNIGSPAIGTFDPTTINADINYSQFGGQGDNGSVADPHAESAKIAGQTIGSLLDPDSLILGKSSATGE